jgi:hypothetical protein
MAEVDTNQLTREHSDIRREAAEHSADIRYNVAERTGDIRREAAEHNTMIQLENMKGFDRVNADVLRGTTETIREGLKESFNVRGDVKDTRYDIASRIESGTARTIADVDRNADRMDARFFDVARDTQDIRAQIIAQQQQVVAGFLGVAKDSEINALKTQVELAKQTTYLSDKIDFGNTKTQDLISALRAADQDRMLIERNADLIGERHHSRHWKHGYNNAQWNAVQSNLNAFQSQLQETRQGMVNFGTMSGQSGQQTSTSNNVR